MDTILSLAYLVQYGALVAVGALVVGTVNELVRTKVAESAVLGSASVQEPIKGHALQNRRHELWAMPKVQSERPGTMSPIGGV